MLFAARGETRPRAALLRAAAIAAVEGLPLRVVLSIGLSPTTSRMLFPHRSMEALRRNVREEHRVALAREWVSRLAPDARIDVERGDLSTVVLATARRLGAATLVVPAADLALRRDAVWLATELQIPVLVARGAGGRTAVLAATDMRDSELPVVGSAAALARRTRGRVVAIHNVPTAVVLPMNPYGSARTIGASAPELLAASDRLRDAASREHGVVETILAAETDTSAAVVEAASNLAADVVAIGARRRNWLDRLLFGSVAENVVERCNSSVMVMPLDSGSAARTAPLPA